MATCCFLCYDYQSFKVVTEIPKSVFSDTIVSEHLWSILNNVATHYKNQFQFKWTPR